jgi:hypothetical protein
LKTGVVAFAFGDGDIPPNHEIALVAERHAYADGEVWEILTQKEVPIYRSAGDPYFIEYISEQANGEPTLRIARWMVARAVKLGIKKLIVVAAGPHVWRCMRDLRYAIKESGVQIQLEQSQFSSFKAWFCEESSQSRTRSFRAWWPRELILRCIPMWIYTLIAG